MLHRLFAAAAFAAALAAAVLTPAAADTTAPVGPLSTSTWTDLGTGPRFVYVLKGAGASYQIADTQPSAASAGVPLPGNGRDLQTSSHIWALAAPGPATTLLVVPIAAWGGPTSVAIGGTLPAFASTPTVNVGTMPSVAVTGTFWQTTQPVSLASLPALAAGSATIGKVDQGAPNATPWNSNLTQLGGVAVSTGAGATDGGTQRVVANFGTLGQAATASSAPVTLPSDVTASIIVTPTGTSGSSYGTNYVYGGLVTFANAFGPAGSGVIQSIRVTGKKAYTTGVKLCFFNANPSNTTWTDAAAAAINAADMTKVIGCYALSPDNSLGTVAVYTLDGIGKAANIGSTTLYGVMLTSTTLSATTGSTTDFTISVSTLKD